MKSRIVFTCNSRISEQEVEFFALLHAKLSDLEYELVFLSPNEYPGMASFTLKRQEWGMGTHCFAFDSVPAKKAVGLIDVEKWLLRMSYLRGSPTGQRNCLPLLEQVAGESLALIEHLEPCLLVAWNSLYPFPGVMYDIAKKLGVPVVDSERGMLPGTLQLDSGLRGLHNSICNLSFSEIGLKGSLRQWATIGDSFLESAYSGDFCRYPVPKNSAIDLPGLSGSATKGPRVLVAGAFDHACGISPDDPERKEILPEFNSGFDVAKHVSRFNLGLTVYKPHPSMVGSARYYDARGSRNLMICNGHPRQFLEWADIVVCYGSLEYDALAFGKPVVLVGRSSLFGKEICFESLSPESLGSALTTAYDHRGFDRKLQRFKALVGYLIENRLFRFDTALQRSRSADRWCRELTSFSSARELRRSFNSVKEELVYEPNRESVVRRALRPFVPSVVKKKLRDWGHKLP